MLGSREEAAVCGSFMTVSVLFGFFFLWKYTLWHLETSFSSKGFTLKKLLIWICLRTMSKAHHPCSSLSPSLNFCFSKLIFFSSLLFLKQLLNGLCTAHASFAVKFTTKRCFNKNNLSTACTKMFVTDNSYFSERKEKSNHISFTLIHSSIKKLIFTYHHFLHNPFLSARALLSISSTSFFFGRYGSSRHLCLIQFPSSAGYSACILFLFSGVPLRLLVPNVAAWLYVFFSLLWTPRCVFTLFLSLSLPFFPTLADPLFPLSLSGVVIPVHRRVYLASQPSLRLLLSLLMHYSRKLFYTNQPRSFIGGR